MGGGWAVRSLPVLTEKLAVLIKWQQNSFLQCHCLLFLGTEIYLLKL